VEDPRLPNLQHIHTVIRRRQSWSRTSPTTSTWLRHGRTTSCSTTRA